MPRQAGQAAVARKAAELERLTVEYVPLDTLKPNDYNPNRQSKRDFELLCRSIREDGFTQPVIVAEDYVIVDGEHRWRAARECGLTTIPVVRLPMDAAQARIATLRHNRARGTEDLELGVAVLRDLERLGALAWAADSLMIDDDALNHLLEEVPAPEALAAEEWSPAWEPSEADRYQPRVTDEGRQVDSTNGVLSQVDEAEQRRREATGDGRQAMVGAGVYTLNLVFLGDDAKAVNLVLGTQPAARLLALCEEELQRA